MKRINLLWFVGAEKEDFILDKPRDAVTGAQTTTLEILRNIDQSKFSVFLGIDGYTPLKDEFKKCASIVPFKTRWQFDTRGLKMLRAVVEKENIDIVHTQGMRRTFLCFLLGKRKGLIRILTRHIPFADDFYPNIKKIIYGQFDRCSLKTADAIVTVAKYAKKRIVETRGIYPEKIRVIYNGIDVERFDPNKIDPIQPRSELSISSKSNVVTTIASLTERKGHKFLFQAASEILERFPDTVFLIVGDGYYKETLEQIIAKEGIKKNVIFAGFRKDVERILKISDILVLPSLSEGFPDVILEAMAMRKPVVATRIAGIPEMIDDGINGFLVPSRNVKKLKAGIIAILENRELAKLMGERNRKKIVEKFNVKKMVKYYERLYIDLYRLKKAK